VGNIWSYAAKKLVKQLVELLISNLTLILKMRMILTINGVSVRNLRVITL